MIEVATKLSEKHRQRIILRHKAAIERYGYQPFALFWKGKDVQDLRFSLFLDWMETNPPSLPENVLPSVLDVGCGFADLYKYFNNHGLVVDYTGLDVCPDMTFAAGNMHPDVTLLTGELFDFDLTDNSYDWVLLSGALNEIVDDTGDYAFSVIRKMYNLSKHGVAFNLLNQAQAWTFQAQDLMSFDADKVKSYCQTFCPHVEVRMDYLPNDFTVFLHKSPRG